MQRRVQLPRRLIKPRRHLNLVLQHRYWPGTLRAWYGFRSGSSLVLLPFALCTLASGCCHLQSKLCCLHRRYGRPSFRQPCLRSSCILISTHSRYDNELCAERHAAACMLSVKMSMCQTALDFSDKLFRKCSTGCLRAQCKSVRANRVCHKAVPIATGRYQVSAHGGRPTGAISMCAAAGSDLT
jgi:hypothetical protein